MNPHFREVLSEFCEEGVEFLLVGAQAVAAHGLPRATGDIDLWIRCSPENAKKVWRALSKFGAPIKDISIEDFQTPDLIIQVGLPPSRIDVITSIEAVEFDEAWAHKMEVVVEGLKIFVLSREHLIRNKKAAGRSQDIADVERLEQQEKASQKKRR